jgi:hypothetical protein
MEYNVVISPEAEKDLSTAFLWYEDKRLGTLKRLNPDV